MNKITLIIAAAALIFCIINTIATAAANRRALKAKEAHEELNKRFESAKVLSDYNEQLLRKLSGEFSAAQIKIDILNHQQSELKADIAQAESKYNELKKSIKKTTFQDSSKTSILNHLPK